KTKTEYRKVLRRHFALKEMLRHGETRKEEGEEDRCEKVLKIRSEDDPIGEKDRGQTQRCRKIEIQNSVEQESREKSGKACDKGRRQDEGRRQDKGCRQKENGCEDGAEARDAKIRREPRIVFTCRS